MTIAANVYFAPADLQDVLSSAGVSLRTDDSPPTAYGGAAAKAGNRVDFYLGQRYAPEQLVQSDLVKDWAVALACYYLSTRRGNTAPDGVVQQYEAALDEMKEIQKGRNQIPGIAQRSSLVPMTAKMVSRQRPYNMAKVEVQLGSKAVGTIMNFHQHADAWDRFGWNSDAILDNSI